LRGNGISTKAMAENILSKGAGVYGAQKVGAAKAFMRQFDAGVQAKAARVKARRGRRR